MSRGIKDLRELICVSRLTIRDSDEEIIISDDEGGRISRFNYSAFDEEGRISRFNYPGFSYQSSSTDTSRQSSAQSQRGRSQNSPDSGISTANGISPDGDILRLSKSGSISGIPAGEPQHVPAPPQGKKKKKKRQRSHKEVKILDTLPTMHELPKPKPLPPVRTDSFSPPPESSSPSVYSSDEDCAETSEPIKTPVPPQNPAFSRSAMFSRVRGAKPSASSVPLSKGNFDYMLTFLDATLISEWLSISNEAVVDITSWCQKGENYVRFAHFWLSEMPPMQRQEILKLEYSILIDQFQLAFASGRDVGQVKYKDLVHFMQAVFKEYPAGLFSSKGSHMFLNYLDVLTSERTEEYKKLLTDAKCSTKVGKTM